MEVPQRVRSFPSGPVGLGVIVVCLALAASAIYSYTTLVRLLVDFLVSRGRDLLTLLDARTRGRGPGGRTDPAVWESALEEALTVHEDTVVFLEAVSAGGQVIARAGEERPDLYVFDSPLPTPRQAGRAGGQSATGWRLRVGLDPDSAAFITRVAAAQAAVAAVAIVALLATAAYSLRTVRRYVALRTQEEKARHLADLGRMSATLAHEIRNPLGAVKGLTQVAMEKLPPEHAARAHMATVVGEAERLERLVTELLLFARQKEPEISRFDLADAVVQARDTVAAAAAEKGVGVLIEDAEGTDGEPGTSGEDSGALWVHSDRDGIHQVLLNVLLNAIQASSEGEEVLVRLRQQKPGRVALVIDDRGPGLQDQDPEELFAPFSTTKTQGSGLGLAVSRQIVGRLGGTVGLENRSGGGARCTIDLPLKGPR